MKRSKTIFWLLLGAINLSVIGLGLAWFFSNYTFLVYKKHSVSEFTQLQKSLRVTGPSMQKGSAMADGVTIEDLEDKVRLEVHKPHPYCSVKTQPGVRGKTDSTGRLDEFYINELGFRSESLGAKKPGVLRIAMIGGSTVWLGKRNDTTIVARLSQLFEEQGQPTEFINAGIVSAVTSQELSVLVHDILDLDVDLVISLDGFNDICGPLHYHGRVGWPVHGAKDYYPEIPRTTTISEETMRTFLDHYMRTIDKFATICEAYGIKYMAVLQPARMYEEYEENPNEAKTHPFLTFYNAVIQAFGELDAVRRRGGHYISLAGFVDYERYWDPVHFDDEGNALIAAELFRLINERGILKSSETSYLNQ